MSQADKDSGVILKRLESVGFANGHGWGPAGCGMTLNYLAQVDDGVFDFVVDRGLVGRCLGPCLDEMGRALSASKPVLDGEAQVLVT